MSGGGTAGHVYPALAVADLLVAEGHDVLYVGTPTGLEARIAPDAGIEFRGLAARGYDRSRPLTLATSSAVIAASSLRARGIIKSWKPDVVAGFGGYVSIPVGMGARLARVPLVLHEQNSVPGLANRTLSKWAQTVGVTYEESAEHLSDPGSAMLTGNPVRSAILASDHGPGRSALGVPSDAVMLLVFGGSRGARHINEALLGSRDSILADPRVHILHVAGPDEHAAVAKELADDDDTRAERYHLLEYIEDMGSALAAADVVVSRAGATSIAEITALGRPAVLVPYPYATDDHQTKNARAVVDHGGAVLVPDTALDTPEFADTVTRLLSDGQTRATMAAASAELGRPRACEAVAEMILEAGAGETGSSRE